MDSQLGDLASGIAVLPTDSVNEIKGLHWREPQIIPALRLSTDLVAGDVLRVVLLNHTQDD